MQITRPASKLALPKNAKCVFKGIIYDVYQWQQEQFDGSLATFEKLKRPDTVMILPITPEKKIMIIELEEPGRKPYLAATGGRVDPGEKILDAAKREMLEESGYIAEEFILWDAQQPFAKIEWAIYTFLAKNIHKIKEQELDNGEKIKLKFVSFDEFIDLVISGQFTDNEILRKIMQAKLDSQKMSLLKKLFLG